MAAEVRAGARAYQEIKRAILNGDLRQRQRLDIDELAARWRVSATPVRHALAVLTSERLVTAHAARGYHVAFWSEAELLQLYQWRWQLARLATETSQPKGEEVIAADAPYIERLAGTWRRLAFGANDELRRASLSADERLRAAYRVEPEVLPQLDRELSLLLESIESADPKRILQRLKLFFGRRIADSNAIRVRASVKALPRNGD